MLSAFISTYRRVIQFFKRAKKRVNRASLILRWQWGSTGGAPQPELGTSDVFEKLGISVINLDERVERYAAFCSQMDNLGVARWTRIQAINGAPLSPGLAPFFAGSTGCTLSHIRALESADWKSIDALMICEDDLEFLVGRSELEQVLFEFLSNPRLDVLALYGRARGGSASVSTHLRIVVGLVGRVCYVVKPHMVQPLIERFQAGVPLLARGKRKGKGDQMWRKLQRTKYFFASPKKAFVQNSGGYSDIEGRELGPR
jgi:hypothetical protein